MWHALSYRRYRWIIILSALSVMTALWLSQLVVFSLPGNTHATQSPTYSQCAAPDNLRDSHHVSAHVSAPTVDMCLLVIAADGKEADLSAIRQILDYLGTPYAVYYAAKTPGKLTATALSVANHAFYQGIILTNDIVGYYQSNKWVSALTSTEWNALHAYEAKFGIRQVTWYAYPTPDMGFETTEANVSTATTPVIARFTAAGQSVFPYVNASNPLTIQGGYVYLARPLTRANVVPLLQDSAGHALAAIETYVDGRQNLALTFDSNAQEIYSQVLSYGLISWVTRGLFLGEHHVYLTPQVDDVFIPDRVRLPDTPCVSSTTAPSANDGPATTSSSSGADYRMSATDLQNVALWQREMNAQSITRHLRLTFAFNGFGTSHDDRTGRPLKQADPLTQRVVQLQDQFYWVSHTYGHVNMDNMSYANARSEVLRNEVIARKLHLTHFSPLNLVTPEISGLYNAQAMRAAYDSGVRYIVSDPSRKGENNLSPNAGYVNPLQPSILMIPRYPTNVGFDVGTPQELASEYNCAYALLWGRDLTYPEILDKQSQVLLTRMLKGDIDPIAFHQTNLRAYDGRHFLLGDVLDATLAKYERLFNLPVISLSMDTLGEQMAARMQYNSAHITAAIVSGHKIVLTANKAVAVPVTGLRAADSEYYGGQYISHIHLNAGQTVTLPLP
jgi:peptidoglycan/xylan/chitin deacetylase (PgdA/CDA1 family)